MSKTRYATVHGADSRRQVEAYLPSNYRLVGDITARDGGADSPARDHIYLIEGDDSAGWTLEDYVIPRYASGLIWCEELNVVEAEYQKERLTEWKHNLPVEGG